MGLLNADLTYYPTTTLVEDFAASWCVTCLDAIAGIDVLHQHYNPSEMISIRYYTTSGDLSNPEVDARFDHYQVFGVPSVFFNGKFRVDGGGEDIANGNTYMTKIANYIHHGSPLKIDINGWNQQTGRITGSVIKVSPNQNVVEQNLHILLLEDNVLANATKVVRSIATYPITLGGVGSEQSFDHTFTINPLWQNANLWAAVFVQLDDDTILQTAHTKPLPQYNLRAAMNWDQQIVGGTNTNYLSQPFYFFNLGAAEDYMMRIVVDSAPENWYFNYCDEEGFCYPGSVSLPMNLTAGEARPYHLNLMIGNTGTAYFHWEVTSPNIGTYIIPFRYRTDDVSNEDETSLPLPMVLGRNYPNPFKTQTSFPLYSEKANSNATLQVFNIKGQLVKEIEYQNLAQGNNTISLSAGESLSSGVYLYRLKDLPQVPMRRMLITK